MESRVLIKSFIISLEILVSLPVLAQDSLQHRFIFIGNAGKYGSENVHETLSANVIENKTSVVLLGNTIRSATSADVSLGALRRIRRSVGPSVPIYVIPGRTEWQRISITNMNSSPIDPTDSLTLFVPLMGCPGPQAVTLSDSLTAIFLDTESILFENLSEREGCELLSAHEILIALERILHEHKSKTVFLLMYRPLKSDGFFGGGTTLNDHLFPFRRSKFGRYVPLPIVGSGYVAGRKLLPSDNDLRSARYERLIEAVAEVISDFENVIVVSGHDPSLQIIPGVNLQIVSAAFDQGHRVRNSTSAISGSSAGFITADIKPANILITVVEEGPASVRSQSYQHVPFKNIKIIEMVGKQVNADSVRIAVKGEYNSVGSFHRFALGENYRYEWAVEEKLPVLRLSEFNGGLRVIKKGGGMQTVSLRLKDFNGVEWVLRQIEKNPSGLLPPPLRHTFAEDILDDEISAQHLYGPLIVPVLAEAAGVPHATPVIGLIPPDTNFHFFNKLFANKVALLEQRDPIGKSISTRELMIKLLSDNDHQIEGELFLRARLLDVLIADWDRHPDQWRWVAVKNGNRTTYLPVPRDRDQAFYKNEGLFPFIASQSWLMPTLQGFKAEIRKPKFLLMKSQFMSSIPTAHVDMDRLLKITSDFQQNVTDSVIHRSVSQLPMQSRTYRGEDIETTLKSRRDQLDSKMLSAFTFLNRIIDLRLTDKNELIEISDSTENVVVISIFKIQSDGQKIRTLVRRLVDVAITREIRIYLEGGNDSAILNTTNKHLKIRIVGGSGQKRYYVVNANGNSFIYDLPSAHFEGLAHGFKKRLNRDTLRLKFIPVNLYNKTEPLVNLAVNLDDGFLLGLGFRHHHHRFRKADFGSVQELMASTAFGNRAFTVSYKGYWQKLAGKNDLVLQAVINAPTNTQNFFGRGNRTRRIEDRILFYRARYNYYTFKSQFERRLTRITKLSYGLTFEQYYAEQSENEGRLISNKTSIGSYDSTSIFRSKTHVGVTVRLNRDTRNNRLLPSSGNFLTTTFHGNLAATVSARSYSQIISEYSFYKSLNRRQSLVYAQRFGGGLSIGEPAFYQSLFLGGNNNLNGYSVNRFAGRHLAYSNTELRIRLGQTGGHFLPAQLGINTFFDTGRVWEHGEESHIWHIGYGAGLYLAPVSMAIFQFTLGRSNEGLYPYFTMHLRF